MAWSREDAFPATEGPVGDNESFGSGFALAVTEEVAVLSSLTCEINTKIGAHPAGYIPFQICSGGAPPVACTQLAARKQSLSRHRQAIAERHSTQF